MENHNIVRSNQSSGEIQKSSTPTIAAQRISSNPATQALFADLKELFKGIANFENKNGFGNRLYTKDTDVGLKPEQRVTQANGSTTGSSLNQFA